MTYKVFVDVNVFEDVIRQREGWVESSKILNLVQGKRVEGWISSLTKSILYFLNSKKIGEKEARRLVG